MKKKIIIGSGALAVVALAFFLAHRPIKAPANEGSSPIGAEAALEGASESHSEESNQSPSPQTSTNGLAGQVDPDLNPMNREEFRELLKTTEKSIPTIAELRKLPPEEVHLTPRVLQEAGLQLGRVAEALENNPALAFDGMSFYEKCVLRESNPTPVRALCLADYEKLGEKSHLPVRQGIAPDHIRELADQVKSI